MRFLYTAPVAQAGLAIAQGAQAKTDQYKKARQAEGKYDLAQEDWASYLDELKASYAPQLRGEALPGDLAFQKDATNRAIEESTKSNQMLKRNMGSSGVTGGVGSTSVPAKGFRKIEDDKLDYLAKIDSALAQTLSDRQFQANQLINQATLQKDQSLSQLEGVTEAEKANLRNTQSNANVGAAMGLVNSLASGNTSANDVLPQMAAGSTLGPQGMIPSIIAGLGNMSQGGAFGGGNVVSYDQNGMPVQGQGANPSQMNMQMAMQQVMQQLGINPQAFAQPNASVPEQRGDQLYTPQYTTDAFGNKRISGYDTSPAYGAGKPMTEYQKESIELKKNAPKKPTSNTAINNKMISEMKKDEVTGADFAPGEFEKYRKQMQAYLETGGRVPRPVLKDPLGRGNTKVINYVGK